MRGGCSGGAASSNRTAGRPDPARRSLARASVRSDVAIGSFLPQGEVRLLLAQGMSHETIAGRMCVAPSTADCHVRRLYAKLDAQARDEAIACVPAAGEATVDTQRFRSPVRTGDPSHAGR